MKATLDAQKPGPVIVWLRTDLRLGDNPALEAACETGRDVLCVFILETDETLKARGGATRWWLHGSLLAIGRDIEKRGGRLVLCKGASRSLIPRICKAAGAAAIVWNRRYGEAERTLDAALKKQLQDDGLVAESFNSHLLYEPWEVTTKAGTPMRVFTPFWRAARQTHEPMTPRPAPKQIPDGKLAKVKLPDEVALDDLDLLPTKPDWASGMRDAWQPGETGAEKTLRTFLKTGIDGYAENRNLPDRPSTSRLSPYLKFGEISPRQIWHAVDHAAQNGTLKASADDVSKFLAELGWREFSYHLLFHFPKLGSENFQSKFDAFPWASDTAHLKAWQRGRTGYPIVDAAMRQLWVTGWMHNRMRMVAASFLIKHLLIDWREGEAWFWDTLLDADPASNTASWQWVAGSGADAAPYFRIFNPISQGQKFDTEGNYVREFVPELAKLPAKYIHNPWIAPKSVLDAAGVTLGETYPHPIVDHDRARQRALAAFKSIGTIDA
ncbi:MAG: DNA photolyase family protein [Beijerinckiaceae bacterium]|nr:DNA photolyase family protein [Beijerinckiaceae bacterium]